MPFQKGHKGFRKKGEFKHSEEAKRKMSNSRKKYLRIYPHPMLGKHLSTETKQKLRLANLNRKHSEKTRKKIGFASKGRKHTLATKQKLSKDRIGSKNPHWKGGRKIQWGYIYILKPSHPFATKSGYIAEHRLIMEKKLKRFLFPFEQVHHINENLSDNRIENLHLFSSNSKHIEFHWKKRKS